MKEKSFKILKEMFGENYTDEQLREIIQDYERLKKGTVKIVLKGAKKVKTTFKAAKEGMKKFTDFIIARRESKEKSFADEIAIIEKQQQIIKDRLKEAEENHSSKKFNDRVYEDIKAGLNKQLSILESEKAKFQAKKDNKWALGSVLREQKEKQEDRKFAKTVVGMVREEANVLDVKSRAAVQVAPNLEKQLPTASVSDLPKAKEDERVIVQKPLVLSLSSVEEKDKIDNKEPAVKPISDKRSDSKLKIKDYFSSFETKLGEKLTRQLETFKQGFISDVKDELQNVLEERDRKHAEEITKTKEDNKNEIAAIKENNKRKIEELLEQVNTLKQQNAEIKKEMENIRDNVRLTPEVMGALGTLVDWTSGLGKASKEGSLGISTPSTEKELETNEMIAKQQQNLDAKNKSLDEGLTAHQKVLGS